MAICSVGGLDIGVIVQGEAYDRDTALGTLKLICKLGFKDF